MSIRVGLQPRSRVLVGFRCPKGEQITNGGFETGDFTDWTTSLDPEIKILHPHSGTYSAVLHCDSCYHEGGDDIEQELNLPVHCIQSFTLWIRGGYFYCPPEGAKQKITLTFQDYGDLVINREVAEADDDTYVEVDLKAVIDAEGIAGDDVLTNFKIESVYIFSSYVDDISLISA